MSYRPVHPSRMSLPELVATWSTNGETPLPECIYDPELHVGPRLQIETAAERAAREAVAREVCEDCPARALCEAYALRVRPTSGIWAGRTAADITQVRFIELTSLEVA